MMEIKKITLNSDYVEQLIELSKIWAEEKITVGLVPNDEADLKEPCVAAITNGKIVGYAFGHYYNMQKKFGEIEKGAKCFDVDEIYVLPNFRSQGIGKMLLDKLKEEVKKEASYLTLVTSTKDEKKIVHFYQEVGEMTFGYAYFYQNLNKLEEEN